MALGFPLTASQPFSITLPTTATVNDAGEVVCDLSANATEAMAAAVAAQDTADGAVLDAAAAQADADAAGLAAIAAQSTADAAVPKTDTVPLFSPRMSLIATETGTVYRFRPGFEGVLVEAQFIIDGVTVATGSASVEVAVAGTPASTDDALSAPIASPAGFAVSTLFTTRTPFTRYQTISFTVTTTNSAATFGTVTLGCERV